MSSTAKASADVKGACADVKGCCVDVKGYYAPSGSRRPSCPALQRHRRMLRAIVRMLRAIVRMLRAVVWTLRAIMLRQVRGARHVQHCESTGRVRTVDFKAPIPHGDGAVSE
eukprot:1185103-Prorocentrum_minimum.AAC.6